MLMPLMSLIAEFNWRQFNPGKRGRRAPKAATKASIQTKYQSIGFQAAWFRDYKTWEDSFGQLAHQTDGRNQL